MKKILKDYTYTWKEIGIFKLALLSIGAIIGTSAHEFFRANMGILVLVAVLATAYIMRVSLKK